MKKKRKWIIISSVLLVLLLWVSMYFDFFCILPWTIDNHYWGISKTMLFIGTDIDSQYSPSGRSSLHLAVSHNDKDAVLWLINNGANVNLADNQKTTPLHLVRDPDIVGVLLSNGASINMKDELGCTPMFYLSLKKDVLEYFSQKKDISIKNEKNNWGITPLHLVEEQASADMLISLGANINAQTNKGDTPLHLAVMQDNIDMVKFLISKSADTKITNNEGLLPIDYAHSEKMKVALLTK